MSSQAVLAYGCIPERANDWTPANLHLPQGAIINGNHNEVHPIKLRDPEEVQEFVVHSWYTYGQPGKGLHLRDGVTDEAEYCSRLQQHFYDKLIANLKNGGLSTANVSKWDPSAWPKEARGGGHSEAPRGVLGHWIKIKDGLIENYQCVVPTTWNGLPNDTQGSIGAFEASLMDTKMERPEEPVEILCTLHRFDPRLACSTLVMSADGAELTRVNVR